jgi:hypothetical protein
VNFPHDLLNLFDILEEENDQARAYLIRDVLIGIRITP